MFFHAPWDFFAFLWDFFSWTCQNLKQLKCYPYRQVITGSETARSHDLETGLALERIKRKQAILERLMLEENEIQHGFINKEAQSYLEELTVPVTEHEVQYEQQEKDPFSSTSDVDGVAPELEKGQFPSKSDVDIMPTQTDVVAPAKGGPKRQVKMGPLETYISSGNRLPLLLITNNRDELLKEVRCRSVLMLFFLVLHLLIVLGRL
jgi:hypothetical protein